MNQSTGQRQIRGDSRSRLARRLIIRCFLIHLSIVFVLCSGTSVSAETSSADDTAQSAPSEEARIGFSSSRSVEGELAETADKQKEGPLARFSERKKRLEARTGFAYGFDNNTQYLGTDSDKEPSDGFSNVTRFYSTWTARGRDTPNDGALVFKVEYRTAIGSKISTQALGPSLGYAGVFSSTFSDAGLILTNLFWRKYFVGGRGGYVIGQVDSYDYVNVNSVASPWTAFANLAFEQQPTFAGPAQGLGAALRWRLTDNWQVLGGFADANGDPSEPLKKALDFFDLRETFKHIAIGWNPDWGDRYDRSLQLTFWHVDEREEAGVESGHGAAFAASGRKNKLRPFLRIGYANDAGAALDRAVSVGTGYDARGRRDLAGIAVNWGRAPDNSRDQFTLEAFYRCDITDFLQLTPEIQYVVNPANDPATDEILVAGLRLRAFL